MSRNRLATVCLFLFQWVHTGSAFINNYRCPRSPHVTSLFAKHHHESSVSGKITRMTCKNSYVEFQHLPTNVTITIVGCLHGSVSSANDVHQALCRQNTDAVVLELCPSRYKILKKNKERSSSGIVASMNNKRKPPYEGISYGLSANLLGGVSALQASLSGFQPGLEFTTAIEYVNAQNTKGRSCNLILADQAVDVTLARIDALPKVSYEMLENFYLNRFRWNLSSFDIKSKALIEAIWGPLDLGRVLTRSYHAFFDLMKLTLPPVILLQTILLLASIFLGAALGEDSSGIQQNVNTIDMGAEILLHVSLSATIIISSFILIVLPLVQVVIYERDDQIASGIAATCTLLQQRNQSSDCDEYTPRVVAVLGLLHVNGIVKRLMESSGK